VKPPEPPHAAEETTGDIAQSDRDRCELDVVGCVGQRIWLYIDAPCSKHTDSSQMALHTHTARRWLYTHRQLVDRFLSVASL
jgi:hypothetical protein